MTFWNISFPWERQHMPLERNNYRQQRYNIRRNGIQVVTFLPSWLPFQVSKGQIQNELLFFPTLIFTVIYAWSYYRINDCLPTLWGQYCYWLELSWRAEHEFTSQHSSSITMGKSRRIHENSAEITQAHWIEILIIQMVFNCSFHSFHLENQWPNSFHFTAETENCILLCACSCLCLKDFEFEAMY